MSGYTQYQGEMFAAGYGRLPGAARLSASLADQAAGLTAALGGDATRLLVNLGTGAFALRPTGTRFGAFHGHWSCGTVGNPRQ